MSTTVYFPTLNWPIIKQIWLTLTALKLWKSKT